MKLVDEAGIVTVAETKWKFTAIAWGLAAVCLVQALRPGLLPLDWQPGRDSFAAAALLAFWGYFAGGRRRWEFDLIRAEFRSRRRYPLHSKSTALPLDALRRVVVEDGATDKTAFLTLIHSRGRMRYRNSATSAERPAVEAIAARLRSDLDLRPERFSDMEIIQEVRANGSESAAIAVIKLLKGWSLKRSRDWLRAGMPEQS